MDWLGLPPPLRGLSRRVLSDAGFGEKRSGDCPTGHSRRRPCAVYSFGRLPRIDRGIRGCGTTAPAPCDRIRQAIPPRDASSGDRTPDVAEPPQIYRGHDHLTRSDAGGTAEDLAAGLRREPRGIAAGLFRDCRTCPESRRTDHGRHQRDSIVTPPEG